MKIINLKFPYFYSSAPTSKPLPSADKGLEAVLKLKCNEIDELKKELENYKSCMKEKGIDAASIDSEMSNNAKAGNQNIKKNKPGLEKKYTEEHKKLWENLVMAEIKKSKKYMEGLDRAQKVLNGQLKENNSLKTKLKEAESLSKANNNNSGNFSAKKKLNEEMQKNRKLQERVKQLLDENRQLQKSGGDNLKSEKMGSMYMRMKKSEESFRNLTSHTQEQAKIHINYT